MTVADGLRLKTTIHEGRHMLPNWSGSLDISSGTTSTSEVHEIEVKDEIVNKGKVKVEEYDPEKILDEQETHDLFWPNRNSGITRRVMAEKRKRTVGQETREEPPKRPQPVEPSAIVPSQTAEVDSPEEFRWLLCVSFFISTGCSFNIFRTFEMRSANQPVQVQHSSSSQQTSENYGSWLLSCFQTVDSPKRSNAGSWVEPLLGDLQQTGGIASVENNTPSWHSHDTIGEAEQSEKPSLAGSQTTTAYIDLTVKLSDVVSPQTKTSFCSREDNLTVKKRTSVICQPVESEVPPHTVVAVPVAEIPFAAPSAPRDEWDILKAVVYGGLVESVTSLSVVSAAAASGAKTLDIFILGVANLIGGLPVVYNNIADLQNTGDVAESSEQVGHYWLQMGRRSKYQLHMVIATLSYIFFGLLPPVIYGLSFRTSDNWENKMLVVDAVSLFCIALLAIGKAHVKRPRTYFTTLLYYLSIGFSSSGLSYFAGVLITMLLAHFGIIDHGGPSAPAPPGLSFPEPAAWASY